MRASESVNTPDVFAFTFGIGFAVHRMPGGQLSFELFVSLRFIRNGAEVIAESESLPPGVSRWEKVVKAAGVHVD